MATSAVGIIFADWLARRRERRARRATASDEFRAVFDETVLKLKKQKRWDEGEPYMATEALLNAHDRHSLAIQRFRPYIKRRKRKAFNASADRYHDLVERHPLYDRYDDSGAVLEEATEDQAVRQAKRDELLSCINDLLSYADAT